MWSKGFNFCRISAKIEPILIRLKTALEKPLFFKFRTIKIQNFIETYFVLVTCAFQQTKLPALLHIVQATNE